LIAQNLTRILTVVIGCIGVVWGARMLPQLRRDAYVNELASRILLGSTFRPQQILDVIPDLDAIVNDPHCDARALRSASIVRLQLVEDALANADVGRLDQDFSAGRAVIAKSLACSPSDSYLWLSMFWLDSISRGFRPNDLALLRMSYQQGPDEGWIMVKRNRLALAIFSALPPDLAGLALAEFRELLQPEYVGAAVDNLVGPGWPIHETLLASTREAPETQRMTFARMLYGKGYDVAVPGIARQEFPGH